MRLEALMLGHVRFVVRRAREPVVADLADERLHRQVDLVQTRRQHTRTVRTDRQIDSLTDKQID